MKKWLGVIASAAIAAMALMSPAQARSDTIHGSATTFDSADVFLVRGCDPALARPVTQGGLSGGDSVIVPLSGAPMSLTLSWSAVAAVPGAAVNLSAKFVDGNCRQVPVTSPISMAQNAPWSFTVPAGTRYLFITGHYTAEATVHGLP